MESRTKKLIGAFVCGILAILTSWTIIGGILFGLIGIGLLVQAYEEKHGDRPWWAKSFVTLWRERGSSENSQDSQT